MWQASTITFVTNEERVRAMRHFDDNFPKLNNALTNLCDNMLHDFGFQTTIVVGGPLVRDNSRLSSYVFESSGTTHKKLTFSEYCGTSYQDVSDKFVEYLKSCYPKEKRRLYTLDPVSDAADETSSTPAVSTSSTSNTPAMSPSSTSNSLHLPASQTPHSQPSTTPNRTQRLSKQARMRTGPLPPHLKECVLRNMALARSSRAATVPVDTPATETPPLTTPAVETPFVTPCEMDPLQLQVNSSVVSSSGTTEPNIVATPDDASRITTNDFNDYASDGGSHSSSFPDVFDVGMDDSEPEASGPWVAMDHFTGEIIVNDDLTIAAPTSYQTGMEIGILPRLGIRTLTETEPLALLSVDEDVRPNWLTGAVKEFLRYMPYYGGLGKVIDQFLAQEARLGYPALSQRLALPSHNRPTEVGQFQKWARKYSRGEDVDAEKFGEAVIKWWLTIQPTTRKQWPPTYGPLSADFSFDYFNCGGPNGVFLMILCLGWWANALTVDTNLIDYTLVVNDVSWVLEQIANKEA